MSANQDSHVIPFPLVQWVRMTLLVGILCFTGWYLLQLSTSVSDVYDWLPDDSSRLQTYRWFQQHFGSDDILLVSWEGCTSNDERISQFESHLQDENVENYIGLITGGPNIFKGLIRAGKGLSSEEAHHRLRGMLFGAEKKTTALIVQLSQEGQHHRLEVLEHIFAAARKTPNLKVEELKLAGYPYSGYYADQAIKAGLFKFTPIACLLSTIVAWCCLHSLRTVLVTLTFSGICGFFALALVPACGYQVDGLLTTLPSLVYILAVSSCIHFYNYMQEVQRSASDGTADVQFIAKESLKLGLKPTVVSAVTTSIGMVSLYFSHFAIIRRFGIFCAVGTLSMVLLFFLFGVRPLAWSILNSDGTLQLPLPLRFIQRVCFGIVERFSSVILIVTAIMFLTFALQLRGVETSVAVATHFKESSDYIQDLRWVNREIGPVTSLELVIGLPITSKPLFYDRLCLVRSAELKLQKLPGVTGTWSAITPLPIPDEPPAGLLARRVISYRLKKARDDLMKTDYLSEESNTELWRITVRARELENVNFPEFEEKLTQHVISSFQENNHSDVQVDTTGLLPLYLQSQSHIFDDLAHSYGLAFAVIALVMTVILRSIPGGMIAMFPNLFPCVIVFGTYAALGSPFDFATLITGCVALGIAVDDTTHFLLRYRAHQSYHVHDVAIKNTYQECAPAIIATTLVCCAGILIFAFSPLATQERFTKTIFYLFVVAVLSDLLLLPAILSTQIGRNALKSEVKWSRESDISNSAS